MSTDPTNAVDATRFVLAETWAVSDRALFGKRLHMLSLASDDDVVVLLVESFPGRGVRWHVSPPTGAFADGRDFARGGIREDGGEEALNCAVRTARALAYENYQRWLRGDPPTSTEYPE